LQRLQEIIEEASEIDVERVNLTGTLVGLDVDLRTFHIKVPNAADIDGKWAEEFRYDPQFVLQNRYRAGLIKRSKTYYAYEKEDIDWELSALAPAVETD